MNGGQKIDAKVNGGLMFYNGLCFCFVENPDNKSKDKMYLLIEFRSGQVIDDGICGWGDSRVKDFEGFESLNCELGILEDLRFWKCLRDDYVRSGSLYLCNIDIFCYCWNYLKGVRGKVRGLFKEFLSERGYVEYFGINEDSDILFYARYDDGGMGLVTVRVMFIDWCIEKFKDADKG